MPFQSKAQARYLYAQHPDIAARWERHTPRKKRAKLPERVDKGVSQDFSAGLKMGRKAATMPTVSMHLHPKAPLALKAGALTGKRPKAVATGLGAGVAVPAVAVLHHRRKVTKATHWSDRIIGHHQARIAHHQAQIDRLSTFNRPKRKITKRLPGETKAQAVTRHQRQLGGLFTTAAAVPAILGVRSGIRGARLAEGAQKTAMATRQLQHGATAIGLGAIGSGISSAPVPKRLFTMPNPKRSKQPKIKTTGITSKRHRRRVVVLPNAALQSHRKGSKPAPGYDRSGVGKATRLSPGFDENSVRQQFRAKEQTRAGQTQRRQAKGFGGPGAKPHYNPSTAQRAASFARREDQAVSRAAKPFTRVPHAAPALRTHLAGGQVRDAAIALGAAGVGASYLHRHKVTKANDRERETAGALVGAGSARAGLVVGGQSAKAGLKVHRAKVGTSPVDEGVWARHKASHGVRGPLTSSVPNATKVKIMSSYPKSLPGWRTQRLLAHKNRPSVTAAALLAGGVAGAEAVHRRNAMQKRLSNRESSNLALTGVGTTLGGVGALGASRQVRQTTIARGLHHVAAGNPSAAIRTGVKGIKGAKALERTGAAGVGAGALAGGYALTRRKKVGKSNDMTDAWGVARPDLEVGKLDKPKQGKGREPTSKAFEIPKVPTGITKLPKMGAAAGRDVGSSFKAGLTGKPTVPRGPAGTSALRAGGAARAHPVATGAVLGGGVFGASTLKPRKPKQPAFGAMAKSVMAKSYAAPAMPTGFDRPAFEAVRTVDGQSDFVFSDPGMGEVDKNWDGSYYGSAPIRHQRAPGQGPGAGAAAFLGAAAGAGAPAAAAKIKTTAPKLKRATKAATATLRAR